MDQKGMDHKRMDQKLLQEKILSDPSIVTSMESEVIAAAESDPQRGETRPHARPQSSFSETLPRGAHHGCNVRRCRGPLFAASRQLASTILGALLRQRKYIVQEAASHCDRLDLCPETAFTAALFHRALFHRALRHRALCHRPCGFRRFSPSVTSRSCCHGAALGELSPLADYCRVLSLPRSADRKEGERSAEPSRRSNTARFTEKP